MCLRCHLISCCLAYLLQGCKDIVEALGDVASLYASETDADSAAKVQIR